MTRGKLKYKHGRLIVSASSKLIALNAKQANK